MAAIPTAWLAALLVAAAGPLGCGAGSSGAAPDAQPELYGAGLFSTGTWDFFVAMAPDGSRVLFCRATDDFNHYTIYETRLQPDGHFSAPAIPGFAVRWSNADPHFTPDGGMVYFISNRPAPGDTAESSTYDIWRVQVTAEGAWGVPEQLPPPISLPGVDEWSPSVAANGNLYFGSERPGGLGGMDLWVARRGEHGFQGPENLGAAVNTAGDEVEPWVAPDESYLIFSGKGRADSVGHYDLYQSSQIHGIWGPGRRLGHGVSGPWNDFNQSVSPDGRWLYFSSTRPHSGPIGERFDWPGDSSSVVGIGNGTGDIYRISLAVLGLGPG